MVCSQQGLGGVLTVLSVCKTVTIQAHGKFVCCVLLLFSAEEKLCLLLVLAGKGGH